MGPSLAVGEAGRPVILVVLVAEGGGAAVEGPDVEGVVERIFTVADIERPIAEAAIEVPAMPIDPAVVILAEGLLFGGAALDAQDAVWTGASVAGAEGALAGVP